TLLPLPDLQHVTEPGHRSPGPRRPHPLPHCLTCSTGPAADRPDRRSDLSSSLRPPAGPPERQPMSPTHPLRRSLRRSAALLTASALLAACATDSSTASDSSVTSTPTTATTADPAPTTATIEPLGP